MDPESAIAERAYAIWQEREANGAAGSAEEDWLRAEADIATFKGMPELRDDKPNQASAACA